MLAAETGLELRVRNVRALSCWSGMPLLALLTLFFVSRFGFFRCLGTFLLLGFRRFGLFLPGRFSFVLALMGGWSGFALRFWASFFGSRLGLFLWFLRVSKADKEQQEEGQGRCNSGSVHGCYLLMTTDFQCGSLIPLCRQKPAKVRCTGSNWRMVERIATRYREYCRYRRDELQAARQDRNAWATAFPSAPMHNRQFCFLCPSVTLRASLGSLRLRSMRGGWAGLSGKSDENLVKPAEGRSPTSRKTRDVGHPVFVG